jgi:hypothetical protein
VDRKEMVDSGERAVDAVYAKMVDDYRRAYARFLELLTSG